MRYGYLILILPFLLLSCTPLRVVRLEPTTDKIEYDYGQKVVTDQSSGSEVAISYYDATRDYIVFDLAVENTGDRALTFDPASCTLVPDVGPVSPAIDPEVQLLTMDLEQLQRQRTQRALTGVGAGLIVAGLAFDAGAIGNVGAEGVANAPNFAEEVALSTTEAVVFSIVSANEADTRMAAAVPANQLLFPTSRYFWLDHALRITTIQPGEVAYGKVVFPRNDQASSFAFQVEVDGRVLSFKFKQTVMR